VWQKAESLAVRNTVIFRKFHWAAKIRYFYQYGIETYWLAKPLTEVLESSCLESTPHARRLRILFSDLHKMA